MRVPLGSRNFALTGPIASSTSNGPIRRLSSFLLGRLVFRFF